MSRAEHVHSGTPVRLKDLNLNEHWLQDWLAALSGGDPWSERQTGPAEDGSDRVAPESAQ
jgi:hypothetical protein